MTRADILLLPFSPKPRLIKATDLDQYFTIPAGATGAAAIPLGVGRIDNYVATTAPGIGNDSTEGYSLGSKWFNSVAKEAYICFSAAVGAADWQLSTLTPDELGSAAFTAATAYDPAGAAADAQAAAQEYVDGRIVVLGLNAKGPADAPSTYANGRTTLPVGDDASVWEDLGDSLFTDGISMFLLVDKGISAGDGFSAGSRTLFHSRDGKAYQSFASSDGLNWTAWHRKDNEPDATETIKGVVELATQAEADLGNTGSGDQVVRAKHLRIRQEGGGIIIIGAVNPTADGANTGANSVISGNYNYTNSGTSCQISGKYNSFNTGTYCSISGNYNSSNSGTSCQISGRNNSSNTGAYCSISGYYNSSNTGAYCSISGNYNYANSGTSCQISGANASSNTLGYARVHGGGVLARLIDVVAKTQTVNATPTTLTLGGAAEDATNRINIPANTAWEFTAHIVAKQPSSGNVTKMVRSGLIGNDAGAVTISTIDTVGTDRTLGALAATVAITADDTNDALKIMGTGVAATTIDWACRLEITQVG